MRSGEEGFRSQVSAPDPDSDASEPNVSEELVALRERVRKLERNNLELQRAANDAAMIRRLLDKRVESQRKVNAGLHRSYEEASGFILRGRRLVEALTSATKIETDPALFIAARCWLKEAPASLPSTELRTRIEALNRDAVHGNGDIRRMIDPREVARILTETLGVID